MGDEGEKRIMNSFLVSRLKWEISVDHKLVFDCTSKKISDLYDMHTKNVVRSFLTP